MVGNLFSGGRSRFPGLQAMVTPNPAVPAATASTYASVTNSISFFSTDKELVTDLLCPHCIHFIWEAIETYDAASTFGPVVVSKCPFKNGSKSPGGILMRASENRFERNEWKKVWRGGMKSRN